MSWIHIVVSGDDISCEVVGIGHRFPSTRRVSLVTATALAADGVPTVIRRSNPSPTDAVVG